MVRKSAFLSRFVRKCRLVLVAVQLVVMVILIWVLMVPVSLDLSSAECLVLLMMTAFLLRFVLWKVHVLTAAPLLMTHVYPQECQQRKLL